MMYLNIHVCKTETHEKKKKDKIKKTKKKIDKRQ